MGRPISAARLGAVIEQNGSQIFNLIHRAQALDSGTSAPHYSWLMKRKFLASVVFGVSMVAMQPQPLRFVPFGEGLPTLREWREGFRTLDLNGDGHPDIVHGPPATWSAGTSWVMESGDRGPSWKAARSPSLPYDYGDIEVADFNRRTHGFGAGCSLPGLIGAVGRWPRQFFELEPRLGPDTANSSVFSSRAIRAVD